jgi:hypothetical protein
MTTLLLLLIQSTLKEKPRKVIPTLAAYRIPKIQPPKDSTPTAPSQDAEERPNLVPFDLDHDDPATNLDSQDDALLTLDDKSELMRWHYHLGHLLFAKIHLMAARGEIPK